MASHGSWGRTWCLRMRLQILLNASRDGQASLIPALFNDWLKIHAHDLVTGYLVTLARKVSILQWTVWDSVWGNQFIMGVISKQLTYGCEPALNAKWVLVATEILVWVTVAQILLGSITQMLDLLEASCLKLRNHCRHYVSSVTQLATDTFNSDFLI